MSSRVYVGRLSYDCRERDLEKFFKGYGKVREILLKNGFGFVEFDDPRDADDAVYELNGKELLGDKVILELARGPSRPYPRGYDDVRGGGGGGGRGKWIDNAPNRYGPPMRTDYRLIVENLSSRVSWQDLKDYMRQAGEVTYADAHKSRRNEGVVEFSSYKDMRRAYKDLDDTELSGRRIKLYEDKPHSSSRRSRSRSRSRSKSRSRSHSRSKSRSRSASRSRSKSASRRRSRSPAEKSRSPSGGRSRSKSPRRSRSKSGVGSPAPRETSPGDEP